MCLDPKRLNKALKCPQHRIPTVEELTHHFSGANIFLTLDAKARYLSVKLDVDLQLLTTFQSQFSRYCFERLPFSLSVSQDIYHLKMNQILEQVEGVGITDDVAVYAKTPEEHAIIIHKLLQVVADNSFVFNSKKCNI